MQDSYEEQNINTNLQKSSVMPGASRIVSGLGGICRKDLLELLPTSFKGWCICNWIYV